MIVQHNLTAMNASRMLGITTGQQAKSSEKLSSGYKINRAADDAAGLSISEKMRKQIRGLDRASTNAQDGVSAVQTAEGALTEVHSMLQRMNELAVQSANGTNSESDRDAIQAEVDQLITEIDRVAETTKFNETYLLKGDPNKTEITNKVYKVPQMSLVEDAMAEGSTLTAGTMDKDGKTKYTFTSGLKAGSTWNGKEVVDADAGAGQITVADAKAQELAAINKVITTYADEMGITTLTLQNGENEVESNSTDFKYYEALSLSLHVGADSAADNKIALSIESMSSGYLGITDLKVNGKTHLQATAAIDTIADAIAKVSAQRSDLGAIQNRLEHTIDNLDNVVENTTAAESRIRDTDMADAMVEYSKNNILAQAGQSMLAQANQATQGVLSLLQ
ncbi:MAG: flagellin [Lachnospiraceae bacterium]|nr:flagellin [Lachnospiraceae bacterium]